MPAIFPRPDDLNEVMIVQLREKPKQCEHPNRRVRPSKVLDVGAGRNANAQCHAGLAKAGPFLCLYQVMDLAQKSAKVAPC